jgi:PAS domain S-box-containing protein
LVLAAPDEFTAQVAAAEAGESGEAMSRLRANQTAVLENLEEGFISFTANLEIRTSNALAEAFTGRAPEQLRGSSVKDVMPEPLASILLDRLQRVLRARKPESFEARAFGDNHLSVRVFPLSDGVAALFSNTTERYSLARRMEDSDALAAALAAHSEAVTLKLDARARIETIDPAFAEWSGFATVDVLGHRFVDLVVAPLRRKAAELIEAAMRERDVRETPVTLLGKRGDEIVTRLTVAPIHTDYVPHGVAAVLIKSCP